MASILSIRDLTVSVADRPVVTGLSLRIEQGEIHAIMGPNGSGKSTLAHALMGHPSYQITGGSVRFQGKDLLRLKPHERARAGLFLAFQYPRELSGVSLRNFLFTAFNAQMAARAPERKQVSPIKFKQLLEEKMKQLSLRSAFAERSLNQGFSGGEKKKAEILQLLMLQPALALLDETDSGLDIDALRIVAEGVRSLRGPEFTCLLVTHYARLLQYIIPDKVHVMVHGSIVESGGPELAYRLEQEGYMRYGVQEAS
ncbi:MAG: Fe-S cluster assembly ATPase SufC [Candidatus Peribacteraceae bacterium]|nr:Fe-S cluster assembly ATPase SufC [Candidatus Peribacteraceae bacterium]